ncbi:MAG TPA: hypothetical protein VHE35_32585 [Kofleriaceae bacterium]|nr:hypothetical protein [Kofleriaceae bacterium]
MLAAFAVAGFVACAQGSPGAEDDDNNQQVDARRPTDARATDAHAVDAPFQSVDARTVDAGLPGLDAGLPGLDGGLGGTCSSSDDCQPDECCFGGLMCVPGMSTPLPPPFDCLPD